MSHISPASKQEKFSSALSAPAESGESAEESVKIEQSILKTYRKRIWNPFIGALKDYAMIEEGDRIAVCISGGKDSMLLAKCMQHLQKYSPVSFHVEYLVMDPGYTAENRRQILENARRLGIPVTLREKRIFEVTAGQEKSPCYLCARMRRGCLYKLAQELGCNKIALGHHMDDMIETVLMSMLYGAEVKTMMPKVHSSHYPGMELIRPLYLVKEADIIAWRDHNHLTFLQCACRLTEGLASGRVESKRQEMKELIRELRRKNSAVDRNIFLSVHNVNLGTVIGFRTETETFPFLSEYGRKGSAYWNPPQTVPKTEEGALSASGEQASPSYAGTGGKGESAL